MIDPNCTTKPPISPFAEAGAALLAAGYHPIPIKPRDKVPGQYASGKWGLLPEWTQWRDREPGEYNMRLWTKGYPDANVGVVLGTVHGDHQLIAVDYDTDDVEVLETLSAMLPVSPMTKRGSKGFTAFYLAPKAWRTKRYMIKGKVILEILTGNATRQTVMPPSLHPHGMRYAYTGAEKPVPVLELPQTTDDHLTQLEDALESLGWEAQSEAPFRAREAGNGADSDPNIWRETNNAAMANFDAWVPDLRLPKSRRRASGYEAVATWRPSTTGQPLERRKPNLKFQAGENGGIVDMGTAQRYTPLDVVCAAMRWEFSEAFLWLRKRLGMADPEPITFTVRESIPVRPLPPRPEPEPEPEPVGDTVTAADGTVADAETGEVIEPAPTKPAKAKRAEPDEPNEVPDRLTHVPGLLGEMIEWVNDTARRPNRTFALSTAISVLGTAMARTHFGPTKSGTQLFLLALGPSGSGKDHGLNAASALLEAGGMREQIGPSDFISSSAVVSLLRRKPLCLCLMDEFGGFLKRVNGKRAGSFEQGVTKLMRETWGNKGKAYLTPEWAGRQSERIESPALCIYGVSTPEEFYGALEGGDIINGVLNRFLIFSTSRSVKDARPAEDPDKVPDRVANALKMIFEATRTSGSLPQLAMGRPAFRVVPWASDAVERQWQKLSEDIEALKLRRPAFAPYLARTAEIAVRLATISAVGRELVKPTVSLADLEWGRELAMWSARNMARQAKLFISETETQAETMRILRIITDAGEAAVTHRELVQRYKHRMRARDFNGYIEDLLVAGDIERFQVEQPAGKTGPKVIWYRVAPAKDDGGFF